MFYIFFIYKLEKFRKLNGLKHLNCMFLHQYLRKSGKIQSIEQKKKKNYF